MLAHKTSGSFGGARFKVGGVTLTNGGGTYNGNPSVTFSGGGGSGAAGTVSFTTNNVAGSVTSASASISNGAYSMTSSLPSVTSGGGGGGSGVVASFTGWDASGGRVVAAAGLCEVSTSSVTFTFSGGGGSGAAANPQSSLAPRRCSVLAPGLFSQGTGYTVAPSVVFTLRAGFTTVTLPTAVANLSGGSVVSITMTNAGEYIRDNNQSGGIYGYAVSLVGGNGSGATADGFHGVTRLSYWAGPSAFDGVDGNVGFNFSNYGSGYTSAPSLTPSNYVGNGTLSTTIGRYPASDLLISNGGSGYTSAPTLNVSGGTAASGTVSMSVSVQGSWSTNYTVSSVSVTTQGSGYRSTPTVSFSGGSPVVNATAVARLIG